MKTVAVYWQHFKQHERPFDSYDEALAFLGESDGRAAPAAIRCDDGNVIEGDELSEGLESYLAATGAT